MFTPNKRYTESQTKGTHSQNALPFMGGVGGYTAICEIISPKQNQGRNIIGWKISAQRKFTEICGKAATSFVRSTTSFAEGNFIYALA